MSSILGLLNNFHSTEDLSNVFCFDGISLPNGLFLHGLYFHGGDPITTYPSLGRTET